MRKQFDICGAKPSKMEIKIRVAQKQDMPRVLELIRELADFEKEPDAVKTNVAVLEEQGFGTHPLFTCFLAEVDQKVVGLALVYFRFSTWRGKAVYLEDLIVTESMRGKGVGKALYTQVMQYAKEQEAKVVSWVVLNWNEGAIKFYESTGAIIDKGWYQAYMDEQAIERFLDKQS